VPDHQNSHLSSLLPLLRTILRTTVARLRVRPLAPRPWSMRNMPILDTITKLLMLVLPGLLLPCQSRLIGTPMVGHLCLGKPRHVALIHVIVCILGHYVAHSSADYHRSASPQSIEYPQIPSPHSLVQPCEMYY